LRTEEYRTKRLAKCHVKGWAWRFRGAGSIRGTHYEPIFSLPGSSSKEVLYRPLLTLGY